MYALFTSHVKEMVSMSERFFTELSLTHTDVYVRNRYRYALPIAFDGISAGNNTNLSTFPATIGDRVPISRGSPPYAAMRRTTA
jgi:hypothetical protein